MSTISDLFNSFQGLLQSELSSHMRLTNAYNIADNPEPALRRGYALAIGSGENTEESLSSRITINRALIVVITRGLGGYHTDQAKKGDSEKSLMEDLFKVIRAVEKDPSLNHYDPATTGIAHAKFVGDEGISIVEDTAFIQLRSSFIVKYFEKT